MKRTFFLVILIILVAYHGYAQSDRIQLKNDSTLNPRKQHPNGFKLTLGGPALGASISNSAFINPCGQIEVGLGYVGLYGGYKHHWDGREPKNWTSYSGAAFSANLFILDHLGDDGYYNFDEHFRTNYVLYLPAYGINYVGDKGLSFNAEVAFRFGLRYMVQYPLWFAVGIGWQYKLP